MHVASITVDHTKVPGDLTDFIIKIDLSDLDDSFWDVVANGGGDIRCYKSDGTTQLARDVTKCDTSDNTGEMDIKFSGTLSSSTDTTIQIHADGSSAEPAANSTYGSQAVWSALTARYSCAQQPNGANTILDSTSHAYHMSSNNMETSDRVAGKFTWGLDFGGTNEYLQRAAVLFDSPAFSISCWVKSSVTNQGMGLVSCGDTAGSSNEQCLFLSTAPTPNPAVNAFTRATTTSSAYATSAYSANTWFLAHGVWSAANNRTAYMNGGNSASETTSKTPSGLDTTSIGCRTRSTLDSYLTATLSEIRIWPSALTANWITTEYNNQSSPSTFYSVSDGARTLTADSGSYSITGNDATLKATRILNAETASYSITGNDTGLLCNRFLSCAAGGYTIAGSDANLLYNRVLTADTINYDITGNTANLLCNRILSCSAGSYIITGNSADLLCIRILTAERGNYDITGFDAQFIIGKRLSAESGSFTITGNDTGLRVSRMLSADTGTFTITGQDSNLYYNRILSADRVEYVITGSSANLLYNRKLIGEPGEFLIESGSTNLLYHRIFVVDSGSFVITGNSALLLKGYKLTADNGSYLITGNNANLLTARILSASTGSFSISGNDIGLYYNRILVCNPGSYVITGNSASLLKNYVLSASTGSIIITGNDAIFIKGIRMTAESGNFVITGNDANFNIVHNYILKAGRGQFRFNFNDALLMAPAKTYQWNGTQWIEIKGLKLIS